MAVERLTDYTRRIWTALAADAPVPDMQVGDVIYYMDTSKCSIITAIPAPGSIDTKDLPDIGGGGGGGAIPILAQGTYTLTSNNIAGVNIPVNVTGRVFYAGFITDDQPTVAMTRCAMLNILNAYPDIKTCAVYDLSNVRYHGANGRLQSAAYKQSSGIGTQCVQIAETDPTSMLIYCWGNSYPLLAGDINWFIWGVPV